MAVQIDTPQSKMVGAVKTVPTGNAEAVALKKKEISASPLMGAVKNTAAEYTPITPQQTPSTFKKDVSLGVLETPQQPTMSLDMTPGTALSMPKDKTAQVFSSGSNRAKRFGESMGKVANNIQEYKNKKLYADLYMQGVTGLKKKMAAVKKTIEGAGGNWDMYKPDLSAYLTPDNPEGIKLKEANKAVDAVLLKFLKDKEQFDKTNDVGRGRSAVRKLQDAINNLKDKGINVQTKGIGDSTIYYLTGGTSKEDVVRALMKDLSAEDIDALYTTKTGQDALKSVLDVFPDMKEVFNMMRPFGPGTRSHGGGFNIKVQTTNPTTDAVGDAKKELIKLKGELERETLTTDERSRAAQLRKTMQMSSPGNPAYEEAKAELQDIYKALSARKQALASQIIAYTNEYIPYTITTRDAYLKQPGVAIPTDAMERTDLLYTIKGYESTLRDAYNAFKQIPSFKQLSPQQQLEELMNLAPGVTGNARELLNIKAKDIVGIPMKKPKAAVKKKAAVPTDNSKPAVVTTEAAVSKTGSTPARAKKTVTKVPPKAAPKAVVSEPVATQKTWLDTSSLGVGTDRVSKGLYKWLKGRGLTDKAAAIAELKNQQEKAQESGNTGKASGLQKVIDSL